MRDELACLGGRWPIQPRKQVQGKLSLGSLAMRKVCLEIWWHSAKATYICGRTGLDHSYKENQVWHCDPTPKPLPLTTS